MSRFRFPLVAVLAVLAFPTFASAQFRRVAVRPTVVRPVVGPRFYPGGGGWGGWGGWNIPGPGDYLQGAASVIDAQGRYLISTQEAYLKREEVRAAQLENRRLAFDQHLYERANSPTLEEQREYRRQQEFWRSWNDPPLTEIWSGKALNDLLVALQMARGKQTYSGPTVPLDPGLIQHINVTSGATGGGSLGALSQPDNLQWPLPLQRDPFEKARTEIDKLAPEVVKQAAAGKINVNSFDSFSAAVTRLRSSLRDQVNNMSSTDYIQALRFVNQLNDSVRALQSPNVANFFNAWTLTAQSVGEMIDQMTQKGLRFAPATLGNEAYYTALQRAMATYAAGLPWESLRDLRTQFYSINNPKQ